jgi:periplasmic glucans biosynthesis protein
VKTHLNLLLLVVLTSSFTGCQSIQAMKRLEVDYAYVIDEAKKCAEEPYSAKVKELPKELQNLNYDDYHKLRFIEAQTLWRSEGLAFQAQFFHQGYLFRQPVVLNEFSPTHVQRIPYVSSFFDFKDLPHLEAKLSSDLDYAGFKILYRLNPENRRYDELISFLGASYFRALGSDMFYGLSARGLAVNCGLPQNEEFPRFTRFWLKKPLGDSSSTLLYALMDSPSVTGAYEFILVPGKTTRIDVKAKFFVRENIESFGVAPLTSMFWFGENSMLKPSDPRPEVHDSDGLLWKSSSGNLNWRPLDIAERHRNSRIGLDSPLGFGLMQRDRAFTHYEDLQAHYHHRPSLWVEPRGDWGKGHLRLLEMPTKGEAEDNIVAFWEPQEKLKKGSQCSFEYSLFWTKELYLGDGPQAYVSSTRSGHEWRDQREWVYILEFSPMGGMKFSPDQVPQCETTLDGKAQYTFSQVQWNKETGTWRVTLKLKWSDDSKEPLELGCRLLFTEGRASEMWKYQCSP